MSMLQSIVANGTAAPQVSRQSDTSKLAAIYARVSTTDQADKGYSLPTQLEACQAMARQEGYTVPESHVFVDDYTGTSLNRPQFAQLRDLVRQRLVHAVFVYDLDRLARKLAHHSYSRKNSSRPMWRCVSSPCPMARKRQRRNCCPMSGG